MEIIDPSMFIPGSIFREKDFRDAISQKDWSIFQGKPVLIQGCSKVPIPTWAYLVITAELMSVAKSISYGEPKRPIPVYGKLGGGAPGV